MNESTAELDELQALLDGTFARSSQHLRSIMTPERRLDARRLVDLLTGIAVLNVASVTARGEPRISALDGHFLHGHWHATTAGDSPKARQWLARPAVSAAYTPRDGFGVFCHGRMQFLDPGSSAYEELEVHCVRTYGQSPRAWGSDIVYLRIEPTWFVAFAMTDEEMGQIEADRAERAVTTTSPGVEGIPPLK
jgi:hypothetical protein